MTDSDSDHSMAVDEEDTAPLSPLAVDNTSSMTVAEQDGLSPPSSPSEPESTAGSVTPMPASPAESPAIETDNLQQPFVSALSPSFIDRQPSADTVSPASTSTSTPTTTIAASNTISASFTALSTTPPPAQHPTSDSPPNTTSPSPPTATSNLHLDSAALLATRRPPAEDDCCICFNGDSEDNDPILFCDGPGCTAVVHQSCYGILAVPDGDWLCESCAIKANPALAASTPLLLKTLNRCMLCPDTTGAFKPTADGRGWVHASCAIWTPETGFRDAEKVDTVIGIETIDRRRWRLVCEICRVKQGSCVQCMGRQCSFSCHVTCGWKAGLRIEMQAVGAGDDLEVYKLVYCDKHRNEPWQKASGRWGRGRPRAVRPNDDSTTNGGDSFTSGYQCVRCGSRRRRHECKRDDMDELMEVEEEEEEEDSELLQLWEERNDRETLEERIEREEEEREMERIWESERVSLERDKEEKRKQDRERREKEREERLARGESTLYEELRQAQEESEAKYALGDELDNERPVTTTKRRKRREKSSSTAAVDGEWKEEKTDDKEGTPRIVESKEANDGVGRDGSAAKRRMGRPAGSQTRVRKCAHHRALKERCGRDCPFRPPPFTPEELKARAEQREKKGTKGGKREVRRKMEDAMRMTTSAPGQRKVIREDINVQLGSGQRPQNESKEAPTTPSSAVSSPISALSGSLSTMSVPLSSLNALPPPPFAHPVAPSAIVSNPIAAPPAPIVQPLATSAALVVPRPNAPYVYNTRDGAELSRRVQSLLTASTPDQQRLQLKQLLSDSPPPYCRLVTQRLRELKAEAVLLQWLRDGREHKAWALIQEVLSALVRLVNSLWDEKVAAGVIQEVLIHREGVSEGCKKEASAVWKRLVDIGWVKEAAKTESRNRDAFTMALQAGQLNGVLASSAAVNGGGGGGGSAASDKRSKVVKLPAFTNGDSNNHNSNQPHTSRASPTASTTAPHQPKQHVHNARAVVGMNSERYRQKAMQEEAEKRARETERKREREYQAGLLAAQAYPSHHPPHTNGGWNAASHPAPLSHMQPAALDPLAALGALTGQLFAPSSPPPPPLPQSVPASLGPSLPVTAQVQMADALQAAAMLQAQLQQRVGGMGAFAGLQALDEMIRNGSLHNKR